MLPRFTFLGTYATLDIVLTPRDSGARGGIGAALQFARSSDWVVAHEGLV
jgi:hypothetical protein